MTEGFENSTNGNTAPIQNEINQLLGFFKEDIHKNDIFDLVYFHLKELWLLKTEKKKAWSKERNSKKPFLESGCPTVLPMMA